LKHEMIGKEEDDLKVDDSLQEFQIQLAEQGNVLGALNKEKGIQGGMAKVSYWKV